jgi:hypothetical protein
VVLDEPGKIPAGVFPPGVYELHYRLRKQPAPREQVPVRTRGAFSRSLALHPEAGLPPGVLRFDVGTLEGIAPLGPVERHQNQFTGDNPNDGPGQIFPRFRVEVKQMPGRRHCLLLVLSPDLQREIARTAGASENDNPTDALPKVLRQLVPASADPAERKKAFRLAALLSSAPGLEGTSDDNGVFQIKPFELAHERCQRLPDGHLLLCCSGPALPPAEAKG